ncbi:MAG: hypothetical protein PHW73_01200 [Atribacterota bacterium]|nr:hypothetical protein [Atribacterota bacterium]
MSRQQIAKNRHDFYVSWLRNGQGNRYATSVVEKVCGIRRPTNQPD